MGFSQAIIFVADSLERIAASDWAIPATIALAALIAGSFAMGGFGARLRAGAIRLALIGSLGGICTVVIIAVKGVPETKVAAAPPPAKTAEQALDDWLADRRHRAEATREQPRPRGKSEQAEPIERVHHAASRVRELAAARRDLQRQRDDIARTPEPERTSAQHRRDARVLTGLARIDREEGRIEDSLMRYRAAVTVLARLGDPEAKSAAVEVALHTADALDARNDPAAARSAYRSAIEDQRNLTEIPEPERRRGLAGALVRYAVFEIERRGARLARTALDEADGHYALLRQQRGIFDVTRARADLALARGDIEAARADLASLRKRLAAPQLASLAPEAELIEARIALASGEPGTALKLFARAVDAYRRAPEGVERLRALASALAGHAEAAFAERLRVEARASAAEAIALRQQLGERGQAVRILVQLALWEVGAEDDAAAERALAQAMTAWRTQGSDRIDRESAETITLLCLGALHGRAPCATALAVGAPAAGP